MKILITTFSDQQTASSVLRTLLEERLIACGTIFPKVHSLYHWEGKIEEAEEVVVWMKTVPPLLSSCQKRLAFLHPYKVPEMVVLEPAAIGEAYEKWIEETLGNDLKISTS